MVAVLHTSSLFVASQATSTAAGLDTSAVAGPGTPAVAKQGTFAAVASIADTWPVTACCTPSAAEQATAAASFMGPGSQLDHRPSAASPTQVLTSSI